MAEYDSWPKGSEERGAILRREGLYSAHISEWRKQAEACARQGLATKSKKRRTAEEIELENLRAKNARLEAELAKTKTALEITRKSARALGAALRERGHRATVEAVINEHPCDVEAVMSLKRACELLGANRSTIQRRRQPPKLGPPAPRPAPPNKLTDAERRHILAVLRSEKYGDLEPVWKLSHILIMSKAIDRPSRQSFTSPSTVILMINMDQLGIEPIGRLNGRRAVVTGAGSGIGRATAMRLVGAGAAVALCDIDRPAIEQAVDLIRSAGGTATAVTADVGDDEAVRSAIAQAADNLGGLDTIAACAGIAHPGATHEMPLAAWDTMLRVNLTGVFSTLRHGIPHLLAAGGGSIVTIGSVGSLVAAGQAAAYDASKGGVLQLTRAVAVEYVEHGIRANCVCPGKTKTALAANSRNVAPDFDSSGSIRPAADRVDVPMPWFADPDLIATAATYLLSDSAAFITGVALPVDGGYTAV